MKEWLGRLTKRPTLVLALVAILSGVVGAGIAAWIGQRPDTDPIPGERKVLYYKNPMGTGHVSDKPLKDEMGMDYVPVYADEVQQGDSGPSDTVAISPAIVQSIGVRTAPVTRGAVVNEISANGVVALDEAHTLIVTNKIGGYIERLHVKTVGQTLKQGDPLFDIYSPDLVALMGEYFAAYRYHESLPETANTTTQRNAADLLMTVTKRLQSLDVDRTEIEKVRSERAVPRVVRFYARQNGTVLKKNVTEGASVAAGTELFQLADLSTLWVLADVYAQDYAMLHVGNRARVSVQGLPGKVFDGRVDFIYPTQDAQTRTAKLRIVLSNPQRLLRPDMQATVTIQSGAGPSQLLVPKSAVLRTGKQDLVILALGEGRFRPQVIKLGSESGEHYAVLSGLKEGEVVVTSAQFLIDSESRLQEAFQKLTSESVEKK